MCNLPPPVTSKSQMYAEIIKGTFGNTLPRWFDYRTWREATRDSPDGALWGVQHTTIPGFPGTRLNVPAWDVFDVLTRNGFARSPADYCISPMITTLGLSVLWEGDVTAHYACGNFRPAPGSWRTHMKKPQELRETAYRTLFRQIMTPDSYDDLNNLLERYPGHVVELSICDRNYGTVPGRNACVWEVRRF